MKKLVITIVACISFLTAPTESKCHHASSACPEINKEYLNVHIVSHSHDDVGWLKTVEQYYYGSNNSIQNAGVQYIYDSVLEELWKDPSKKFVSVEVEFFSHWWKEQNAHTKHKMRKVMERGQLEFVGGGWCMNDEAAASYVDIIDQMTLGLKFINDTFGSCAMPKAVWQVDPFGHSREQASIFARMGFEYLFLGRIDHQDKAFRLENKEMEMIWKVSDSLNVDIFTGILYNTYSPPPGFCFDILCGDESIVDDYESPMYNIDRRSKELVAYILEQSKHYRTNNIIVTMGEDFNYQNANAWFKNLDKLIKYINKVYADSNIRLFYSTPSCYGQAVKASLLTNIPTKADDFFPYSSDPHAYWTGYFSSRPAFKGLVRQTSNLLQACKQLQAATVKKRSSTLFQLQRSQAIAQHHDAVTGTAKQHVSNDYVMRLDEGVRGCYGLMSDSFKHLTSINGEHCLMLNVSQCRVSEEHSSFIVSLYNPLSFVSSHLVRLPVNEGSYTVTDHTGAIVTCQITPIVDTVLHLPGRKSSATHELAFQAVDLPPLGVRSYQIRLQPSKRMFRPRARKIQLPTDQDITVSAHGIVLKFDKSTGLLIQLGADKVTQQFFYYQGMAGNNSRFEFRASGAYIFRPNGTAIPAGRITQLSVHSGPVVTEIRQHMDANCTQILRLHRGEPYVELEWILGPIGVRDGIGKEYVTRFTAAQICSNGTFYTDCNGREMLRRQLDEQPAYRVNVTEPTAGNFYPVNSIASVRDDDVGTRMSVLNDRAQGVTSPLPGSLEFMIHRRLLHDDAFGVGEALNETAYGVGLVVRGSHWLIVTNGSAIERPLAQRKAHPPILTFMPTELSPEEFRQSHRMQMSLLRQALPANVNLLTLEPWDDDGRLLVRVEHFYGVGEDDVYSKPVTVSLKDLFATVDIVSVDEVNLSANQMIGRLETKDWSLTLKPMEIRTFLFTTAS